MSVIISKMNADPQWDEIPLTADTGRWLKAGGSWAISCTVTELAATVIGIVNEFAGEGEPTPFGVGEDAGKDPSTWDIPPS